MFGNLFIKRLLSQYRFPVCQFKSGLLTLFSSQAFYAQSFCLPRGKAGKFRPFPPPNDKNNDTTSIVNWRCPNTNWLNRKKTYIVSALMALASLVHLVTGNLIPVEFISSDRMMNLFEALGLITLRAGIRQNQKETTL